MIQPEYHSAGFPPSRLAQKVARLCGSELSSTISRIQPIVPSFPLPVCP